MSATDLAQRKTASSNLIAKLAVGALLSWIALIAYLAWCPFAWTEEVELPSQERINVSRSVERELAWTRRHGLGPIKSHSLSITINGKSIRWATEKDWKLEHMPEILAFVDGDPILIFSVAKFNQCSTVNFPVNGLVGFRYVGKSWSRIDTATLSDTIKVNLLRDTFKFQQTSWHSLGNHFDPEFKMVTLAKKALLESPLQLPPLGASIEQLSKQYVRYRDSCANLKPHASNLGARDTIPLLPNLSLRSSTGVDV